MITLGTGLPGNGKTLFMLWYLKRKADKENRPVFYHNVKDLNGEVLNWSTFDPEKWYDLPNGSIVLIDECQDVFPKKPNGATLPEHYTKLNTHRHLGIDLFLITQHPSLIDNSVRRLVGQHFHSIRKFGLQRATVYEYSSCASSPELDSAQKNAVVMKWKFPKEVFGWYKSAEVHTVKRAIPAKLILACAFVVGIFGYGYYALDQFQQRGKAQQAHVAASQGSISQHGVVPVVAVAQTAARPGYEDPVADAQQYMFNQTPRIESLPETAPRYDGLTVPTRVPVPAMCIQVNDVKSGKKIRCQCYTQQATKMDIDFNMCISIARNGRFMDFDPEPMRREQDRAERSAAILSKEPNLPASSSYETGRVIAFNDVPSGIQGARPAPNLDDGPPPGRTTRTEVVK